MHVSVQCLCRKSVFQAVVAQIRATSNPYCFSRSGSSTKLVTRAEIAVNGTVLDILGYPRTPRQLEEFVNVALLVDKPTDWTSFNVCSKLRGGLKPLKAKVGHAGTLDPLATGLLIICTGKATKKIDMFMNLDKTYSGTIRLGEGTETYDMEGSVTEVLPWQHLTDEDIQAAVQKLMGDQLQVPPMFSAIKMSGVKLYDLARQGINVERVPRRIVIHSFKVWRDNQNDQELNFLVRCSKGTYIRSLAYDLARSLGTVGHLTSLRREAIGDYNVLDAWPLPALVDRITELRHQQDESTVPAAG